MSTNADKGECDKKTTEQTRNINVSDNELFEKRIKPHRKVSFPDEDQLITQYFEPANPWQDVPTTTRAQLAAEYLESCRRHNTPPIESVLEQIRELPENAIGGAARAGRLALCACALLGAAWADALEAVLRKAQFRRLEIDHAEIDDEGAEAIFDMIEYYESAVALCISGPRQFGIRGWQAASRMIKKSAELSELEIKDSPLEAGHAPVLARALRPQTCRLRSLCLQRTSLSGEPLLCLVTALKSNSSVRELRLGDNRLTSTDAAHLGSLLKINTRLQLLDLSNNQIQDAGAGHIADALVEQAAHTPTPPSAAASPETPHAYSMISNHEARGLAFLVLWNNQLTRNSAIHLSKALRSSPSLCVLNVGRNALGSEAVRALCGGRALASLVSLGLQAARLGPDAAAPLAALVRAGAALSRLDLRDNRLGVTGLQTILAAMKENTTLTQIDLDDPAESTSLTAEDSEAATVARLTREIRALCRRNEPDATSPERRVHRKISLTCHTAYLARSPPAEEERRAGGGRLRSPAPSPAPSPAGSPVPAAQPPHSPRSPHSPHSPHSRFSVTLVTPERNSSTESLPPTPARPTYSSTPSRFKVVQVAEPPQIQVESPSTPRRSSSRFSVTRNYDSMYNPSLTPPSPAAPKDSAKQVTSDPRPISSRSEVITLSRPEAKNESKSGEVPKTISVVTLISKPEIVAVSEPRNISTSKQDPVTESIPELTPKSKSEVILGSNSEVVAESKFEVLSEPKFVIVPEPKTEIVSVPTSEAVITSKPEAVPVSKPDAPSGALETVSECDLPASECDRGFGAKPDATSSDKSNLTSGCAIVPVTMTASSGSENIDRSGQASDSTIPPTSVKTTESDIELGVEDPVTVPEPVSTSIKDLKTVESISEVNNDMSSEELSELCVVKTDKTDDRNISIEKSDDVNKIDKVATKSELKTDKIYSDTVKSELPVYKDKSKQIVHDEAVRLVGDDRVLKTETKLLKSSTEVSDTKKVDINIEVIVTKESLQNIVNNSQAAKVHYDQNKYEFRNIDDVTLSNLDNTGKEETPMKQIEAITEDLDHLIQVMKDFTIKNNLSKHKVKIDSTRTDVDNNVDTMNNVPVSLVRDSIVLKKNKSESSLDSPDLEVSRLMNKKLIGSAFCDSSSSFSGSSIESLNDQTPNIKPITIQESVESDTELDRRKPDQITLSTESSIESNTSEVTPVNSSNFLNMSFSSNESVSPIIFGKTQKIHSSLSSLEASVSSLDSNKQEKVMVTSADSGIEHSLQNPSESKEDSSSNEGTLTNTSSLKDTLKKPDNFNLQETLTSSPKRTSSLLDVPALKSKGLDRMRKISWVAPSASFHVPKQEPEKESKLPSHLEKLLSLFQHPSSLFSRSASHEEEKKSASNTPPRKDSSLTSSFWSWGSATEKTEKEDKGDDRESLSEATDSTLSERVQVSFVDESFSKKLDSKTPSTDTDNTLSEFQSLPMQGNSETSDISQDIERKVEQVTDIITTDDVLVQKLDLSFKTDNASSNGNRHRACDTIDLIKPNDLNKNVCDAPAGDSNKNAESTYTIDKNASKSLDVKLDEVNKVEPIRPRSFAAILKSSGSENSLDKQTSPDSGQSVDKFPSKVIRGIKENISPENTLTSSMSNTKALAFELSERQIINQPIVNAVWEVSTPLLDRSGPKIEECKIQSDLAPIATMEETCDEDIFNAEALAFIDDVKTDDKNESVDSGVTLETSDESKLTEVKIGNEFENVDLGKDALSYLIYENQDFEPDADNICGIKSPQSSLAQELKDAEMKEQLLDLSPELVIDEAVEVPEVFATKEIKGFTSPVVPERAKLKKSNSLENLSQMLQLPETKKTKSPTRNIVFKIPSVPSTTPREIPERRPKLRTRSGSSPKSLPESLNKPCPLSKMDPILSKKKKKVSSLGKMARDSLLALNMSEDEIAEFRRSYKLTSVESLRSLESVSEDANSQSGNSVDSRCRACLRTSQESLMSLDSITEDCRCQDDCEKSRCHSAR